jgi:hypothetical protein
MADESGMNRIPLLFTYRDRIVGMGFSALVESFGRVLGVAEGTEDVWIYGVEPGALAASGADPKEALESFRQSFTNVLRDYAAEAQDFVGFRESIERFFSSVNKPNEVEWLEAVAAVRAGKIDIGDVPCEPAESRRFVRVTQEVVAPEARSSFAVTGSSITSSVAA